MCNGGEDIHMRYPRLMCLSRATLSTRLLLLYDTMCCVLSDFA